MFSKTFISSISNQTFPISHQVKSENIGHDILALIHKKHPNFSELDALSIDELNEFRRQYITAKMIAEYKEIDKLRKRGANNLQKNTLNSDDLDMNDELNLSLGQKLSDKVASFGGSWLFIVSFLLFIGIWIISNSILLFSNTFDPYPFIFLNLILSCVAALQAPIIMMSQNRQEEKDRDRAKKDFSVNLKSELEIRLLDSKMDHLMMHQQQELIKIQKIQMDMLNDLQNQLKNLNND